jgi:hypothetical protein
VTEQVAWGWLECDVAFGLFETEYSVTIQVAAQHGGASILLTVDRELVRSGHQVRRGERTRGRVRVLPVRRDDDGSATVLLPVQSVEYGSYVAVPAESLTAR